MLPSPWNKAKFKSDYFGSKQEKWSRFSAPETIFLKADQAELPPRN